MVKLLVAGVSSSKYFGVSNAHHKSGLELVSEDILIFFFSDDIFMRAK